MGAGDIICTLYGDIIWSAACKISTLPAALYLQSWRLSLISEKGFFGHCFCSNTVLEAKKGLFACVVGFVIQT